MEKVIRESENGITSIPYQPIGSRVIVKAYYEVSPFIVEDRKALDNMKPIKQEIVAFGSNVQGLAVGDIVTINPTNAYQMTFKWNEKGIRRYMEDQRLNKTLYTGKEKVVCEEYFLCDYIDVLGIDLYIEPNGQILC